MWYDYNWNLIRNKKRKLDISESTIQRHFYENQGKYLYKLLKSLLTKKHQKKDYNRPKNIKILIRIKLYL